MSRGGGCGGSLKNNLIRVSCSGLREIHLIELGITKLVVRVANRATTHAPHRIEGLLLDRRWVDRSIVLVPVEVVDSPSGGLDFYLGHLGEVFLIVNTIPEDIAEVPQSTFETVGCTLLLGLLKGGRFSLAVLDMTIPDVLDDVSLNDPL